MSPDTNKIRYSDEELAKFDLLLDSGTGELISKERLKAVPHATLSIKAKQDKNK